MTDCNPVESGENFAVRFKIGGDTAADRLFLFQIELSLILEFPNL